VPAAATAVDAADVTVSVEAGRVAAGIKDQGLRIRDQGSGIKDQGSRIRDQGSGIKD